MVKILGIIPARGGSKGIKNKNMQLLNGKPLVLHAADVAIESKVLDRIILSSDDDSAIEAIRNRPQIESTYRRPDHLATDAALIADAISHVLDWLLENQNYTPDAFMLLEPTCPLRTISDLQEAIKLYKSTGKPCVISVSEPQQHPSNMVIRRGESWDYCLKRVPHARGRQDFKETWFINGAVYLTQIEFFKQTQKVYDLNACALYKMPAERALDINSPFDLAMVRAHTTFIKEEEQYAGI